MGRSIGTRVSRETPQSESIWKNAAQKAAPTGHTAATTKPHAQAGGGGASQGRGGGVVIPDPAGPAPPGGFHPDPRPHTRHRGGACGAEGRPFSTLRFPAFTDACSAIR